MKILHHFESGVFQPFEVSGDTVTFNLSPGQRILNVLVKDAPPRLRVRLLVDDKGAGFLLGQGLLVSEEDDDFRPVLLVREDNKAREGNKAGEGNNVLAAEVATFSGRAGLATRYPYGREALDRLVRDVCKTPRVRLDLPRSGHRSVHVFEFGEDDGRKRVHFFVAGEDAWETAGCFVADEIARVLAKGDALAERLLADSVVRVVPVASPYSATQPAASYTTLEGKSIYGAATWGAPEPPPEYAILRDEVVEAIRTRRLGLLLTIHSWQASQDFSGLETIRTAGARSIEGPRLEWARGTLQTLIEGVPRGRAKLAERIWHAGLARDYLLGEHDAITFRIEITTRGQGVREFRETGRALVGNVSRLADWSPVLA